MEPQQQSRGSGLVALSLPSRIVVAAAAVLTAAAVTAHLAMVFLHVAPPNTVTERHGSLIDSYVYPEYEQNWKLFAPDPLQANVAVHARAEVRRNDRTTDTTGWISLTAMDVEHIRGNLAPSHTAQNQLRRAWDFYAGSHDSKDRATGVRGRLSEEYLRRIVMLRFGPELDGGVIERIQVRSATTRVAPPPWSAERVDTRPRYRVLPWWSVRTAHHMPLDDRAAGSRSEGISQ